MSMLNETPPATAAEADGMPCCPECGEPQTVLADEVERVRGLLLAEKAYSRGLLDKLEQVTTQRDAAGAA